MKVKNLNKIPTDKALGILQGQYIGIEIVAKAFSMCAAIPVEHVASGKAVLIEFFPEEGRRIKAGLYGLKAKLARMAVNMCGGYYIPMSMYDTAIKMVEAENIALNEYVSNEILKNAAALKKDYIARCEAAVKAEGLDETAKKSVMARLKGKFPKKFEISLGLNVFSFPTPSNIPDGVSQDIKIAVEHGNNSRIIQAMITMVGGVYNSMFSTAAAVANSMEKNYTGISGRTKASIGKTYQKAVDFESDICDNGKLVLGDFDEAIDAFKKLFLDNLDNITPTTARFYCAALYKSAKVLGVEEQMDISAIGMDQEAMEQVDWSFKDIVGD